MKTRNLIAIVAASIFVLTLGGCSLTGLNTEPTPEELETSRFVIYDSDANQITRDYNVIVDKETGVQYFAMRIGYNWHLMPLFNSDGTLYTVVE